MAFLSTRLCAAALSLGLAVPALAADLPPPYLSRALDAVLIPVTDAVIGTFGLAPDDQGVLVLAVQPGGVADMAGVAPGDIINEVHGNPVLEPVTLDEIVYYFLQQGDTEYAIAGGGRTYAATITTESWTEVIDVTTVSTWSSTTTESFSYEEYTSEYSSEISESYESSEQVIEEEASSEDFAAEIESDAESGAPSMDPDVDSDADGEPDISDADADGDGMADASDSSDDDAGSVDGESGAADGGDSGDSGGDDSGGDDSAGEDSGGDSGGDSEGE